MPKQSRISGAISLLIAQAVVLLFGYAAHLWIGRVLGPAPYGIYGIVLAVQTIFGMFLTLGVPVAVSRFVAQDEKHAQSILQQALRIQGVLALTLAAATAALAPLIARVLGDTSLTPFLLFVAVVVVSQAFYPVYAQFFSGLHRFHKQALLTSLYAAAKLAGAVLLLYALGLWGAFAGFAIGGIIAAVLGWSWTRDIRSPAPLRFPLKDFLSFAGMYVVTLVGLQLLMSLDLFMVKAILADDAQAGYYNAAVTLSRISYFLLQGLAFIILPSVSALTKPGQSRAAAANFIKDTLRYLIALIVPSIALAAATSKELIILFFGSNFIPAAPVLTVLMVGLGALAFYLLLINIAAGAGRAKVGLAITAVLLAVSAALGYVLIPRFGPLGAAWQTTAASLAGLTVMTIFTFRTFKIPVPLKSTVNVLAASAAAVAPTYIWKASPLFLPLQYLLLLGVYVVVLWVLREITPADRERIAGIHPKLAFLGGKSARP